jgi:hypothetical protein
LTLRRCLALEIGPDDLEIDGLEQLRAVWVEHRHRFSPTSWAAMYWEVGIDLRADDDDVDDACLGLPGRG